MKANKASKYFFPCLTVLAAAVSQAYAADESSTVMTGEVTPKLVYFDYSGGPGGNSPQYLQAYGGEHRWSGGYDNSGLYVDMDVSLKMGEQFSLERQGFGRDSHRGNLKGGNSEIGFSGTYSHFRSNSNGLDYLNRPGTANNPVDRNYFFNAAHTNTGFLSRFNDESPANADYHIERTTYGLAMKFKPGLLGKGTSLTLSFDGYKRDGNKFATWVAGNGDFTNGPAAVPNNNPDTTGIRTPQRWRGYQKPVNENMGRFAVNFTAAPAGLFQFAYDGSIEKFNNKARTFMMEEVANLANGVTMTPGQVGQWPMHFVPDTTLMTHAFRLSKNYGSTAVAAGYGMSRLKQDETSVVQNTAGFSGKIGTENAFLNVNHRMSSTVGLEAYVKYYQRDNDSTEAPAGILDRNVRDEWGVRINELETLTYGLAASFSGLPAKSNLTVGWKHEDTARDLQWNLISAAGGSIGQWPTTSLYKDKTQSDEVYLKWSARPMQGMTLRVTPSWLKANKTGLVSEAGDAFNLKTALGYALTKQTHLNAYYNYKDKQNGNNSYFDTVKPTNGPVTTTTEYKQKADDVFHAAGLSLSHAPSEWMNLSGSLDWSQNDFETHFFGTNLRRFESPIVFDPRGASSYKVDTLALSLNADYQPSDQMKLRAGYTLSDSRGDMNTSSTATLAAPYAVNDKIDNMLHSLSFGIDYELKSKLMLKGGYVYDRYRDRVFSNLNGSRHTLMMGVGFGF